jgi:hypothetical protein
LFAPKANWVEPDDGYVVSEAEIYAQEPLCFDPARSRIVTPDGRVWRIIGTGVDVWETASSTVGGVVVKVEHRAIAWDARVEVETAVSDSRDQWGTLIHDWETLFAGPARIRRLDSAPVAASGPNGPIRSARCRGWLPWPELPPAGRPSRVTVTAASDPMLKGHLFGLDWRGWDDLPGCRRFEAERIDRDVR